MKGKKSKDCHIDLGLAISALSLQHGETRTQSELAAFCGCTRTNIGNIEARAIHKLRRALFLRKDPELLELVEYIIHK